MKTTYWPDEYVTKKRTAEEAVAMLASGRRVFIGSSCGEPRRLAEALVASARHFSDIEIVRLMSLENSPITRLAGDDRVENISIRNIYQGSAGAAHLAPNKPFITPMNLSAVPGLFSKNHLHLDAALIQTSPPDDFGWMSLGISVDVGLAAVRAADLVIAQVNSAMPRILGHGFIHVDDVDVIVEHEEDLFTIEQLPELESANAIARLVADMIEDGSTFQLGLGATPKAILLALSQKNDLGVHTQFMINDIMKLMSMGVITNRYKGVNDGKAVASNAAGSSDLYDFLHDNPSIEFYPSDYVNNPRIIASHKCMVSVNMVMEMDLTGQAAVDALPGNFFAGVSSIPEFVRGAAASPGGKSILLIPSTSTDGRVSRIVPFLDSGAVVVPRGEVSYVVSEFGAVNLFGKNLQERAVAMISLAHPDFREKLLAAARQQGIISRARRLTDSLRGVYPAHLEELRTINNEKIQIRPAKPVDDRRIQEHFYALDKKDVIARFFHEKTCFVRKDMEAMFETDYIKDLTLLAVTGEFGFGTVIGIGAYMLEDESGIAEVAFSVARPWQGKGLSSILIKKLANAADANGIKGLVAYIDPINQGMIHLFHRLPYVVHRKRNEDFLELTCYFNEPKNP
ncbi:MAG: GNAT family N-acetyltransferase [Deltaproteobacteria bacterium]|nr:GNAT family N-acetyltransferase [Deltaproteobacteria bacterium]